MKNKNMLAVLIASCLSVSNAYAWEGDQNINVGEGATVSGTHGNIAIGDNATAKNGSLSLGNFTRTDDGSMGFGNGLQVTNGSIAFADKDQQQNFYDADKNSTNHTSYGDGNFHIGNRVIKEVSEGVGDTDAVNVGQLKKAIKDNAGVSKEYVDTNDVKTLDTANKYTDSAAKQAENNANAHSDANDAKTLGAANKYTDNSIKNISVKVGNDVLQKANSHSDKNDVITLNKSYAYADKGDRNTLNNANHYTDNKSAETLKSANAYTDKQVTFLNDKIDDVRDQANAGTAAAMAMASMATQQDYKYNFGLGMGGYGDQGAIAGTVRVHVDDKTFVSLNTSFDTQNNVGLGVGVTWGLN